MLKLLSIIMLVVLSSSVGFWLGQSHANRAKINVLVDGDSLQAGSAVLSHSLAVDGDLKVRSLPNGKVGLEGNLNVRPN